MCSNQVPYCRTPFRVLVRYILPITFVFLAACDQDGFPDPGPPAPPAEIGKARVWLTTGDQTRLLTREPDISITQNAKTDVPTTIIDASTKFQQIEGFGAALTGSSAFIINRRMSAAQRISLLEELFDAEKGIGISYLRMTIGASDFSLSNYTYDDMPVGESDFLLTNFSIEKDRQDIVPVFKAILSISPQVRIMGSPWSAPAWMKTNESLSGGNLKPEAYEVYAQYLVRYIRQYASEGIAIDAITLQNEPLHFTAGYPCMEMLASEQGDFIKNHVGPAFETEAIGTKVIIYDHNWDNTAYAISILNDLAATPYVHGTAFHGYAGNVAAMSTVHNAHPGKGLYFTEISGGAWATNFSDNLQWNLANIFIGSMKNWSRTALLWNLALDENHGPTNNGCQDCRGVVTIESGTGAVTRNVEYYALAHFSKFVRPGAFRIGSTGFNDVPGLDHVAFINSDGSKVIVVSNAWDTGRSFTIKWEDGQLNYLIPAHAVATVVWP